MTTPDSSEIAVADGAPNSRRLLVFRVLDPLPEADLEALRAFERAHGLRILLQPGGLNTIAPLTEGPVDLHYRLDAFDVKLQRYLLIARDAS